MTLTEEFARSAFIGKYEAAHGEGGAEAWERIGDGERELWFEAGRKFEERVSGLAAERDRLIDGLGRYERITTAWTRGMYAARIDCVRGDVKAAVECLSEGLDGYDGTEWDGTETGAQWWERTKAEEGL